MESLILDLIDRISRQMPHVRVVDEDYGQLDMLGRTDRDTYPLVFPAVLVDASDTAWSNVAPRTQKGVATVRVRLIMDCYDDTHAGSGTTGLIAQRDEMRRELHSLVQGFRSGGATGLVRTSSRFYTADHGIKVYEATYTATVTEVIDDPKTVDKKSMRIKIDE